MLQLLLLKHSRLPLLVPSQATRERSVLVNIMRDLPRQDTQPERHAQLLLCMFKPIFAIDDLRLPEDKSWTDALQRTEDSDQWDPRSITMRLNIRAMLTQRLAADEENARRKAELLAARERGEGGEVEGDMFNMAWDDDNTTGDNVLPPAKNAHRVSAYVNDAVDSLLAAGFSRSDVARLPPSTLLSGRTPDLLEADLENVRRGDSESQAKEFMIAFGAKLEQSDARACATEPPEEPAVSDPTSYNPTAMEPYIRDLRNKSQFGLTEEAKHKMNDRRRVTNERVAATDVGRASVHQHDAVNRIAEEFGLNRKQRLAFSFLATRGCRGTGLRTPMPCVCTSLGGPAAAKAMF